MKWKVIGFGVILLVLCGVSLFPVDAITVRHDGKLHHAALLNEEKRFSLRWVHSVEKEEWEEFFYMGTDGITLDSTRFKTFGAGVPSNAGTDSYIKDGWVYMVGIDRLIGEELFIRTGEMTSHRLVNGSSVHFFPARKDAYEIKGETVPLIQIVSFELTQKEVR